MFLHPCFCSVTGTFDLGYLCTVQLGTQEFRGETGHAWECDHLLLGLFPRWGRSEGL